MPNPLSQEQWNQISGRADAALSGGMSYAERSMTDAGKTTVDRVGYPFRGADATLGQILNWPKSEAWVETPGQETTQGWLLRAALTDLNIKARLRDLDSTTTYSVAPGVALLLATTRRSMEKAYGMAGELSLGRDPLSQVISSVRTADARHHSLTKARRDQLNIISPDPENPKAPMPITDPVKQAEAVDKLNEIELSLLDVGIDLGVKWDNLDNTLKMLVLSGESVEGIRACVGKQEKLKELTKRLRDKREKVNRVEESVTGLNEAVRFLEQLVSMQTDIGGIMKVFTGTEPSLATYMWRFMSGSEHLNTAVTIAMRESLRLAYPKTGKTESAMGKGPGGKGHEFVLQALDKYTPAQREKYLKDWEDVVIEQLEKQGIFDGMQLASDAVSISMFLQEIITLGGLAYQRDRDTGRKLGGGGTGSVYDHGGSDATDKMHQLFDRKSGEALKGRIAPRPGVIKGLPQELLYNMLQFQEAKINGVGQGMSVLQAITENDKYTVRDMVENMFAGAHFYAMLYAFRAAQISDKMDQLVNGRISVVKELGGGPEKVVEEMIDSLQGLAKAFQTLPFGRGEVQPWMATLPESDDKRKEADRLKTIEVNRVVINLLSDFYRGATTGSPGAAGYEDNPDFRGIIDLLPKKVYERFVVYTNLLTPQQFYMAIDMARDIAEGNMGGVLTEEMVYEGPMSQSLQELLSQKRSDSDESLLNLVLAYGVEGTAETQGEMNKAIKALINKSADDADKGEVMTTDTMKKRAERRNPKLKKKRTRIK